MWRWRVVKIMSPEFAPRLPSSTVQVQLRLQAGTLSMGWITALKTPALARWASGNDEAARVARESLHRLRAEGTDRAIVDSMEQADLAVYELLREVALDQASFSFWEGVDQLADELEATNPTEPTTCFFVCLSCISAILAYVASVGGLVVGCATLTPVCILAILGHQATNLALIAACGACATCVDSESREQGYGSGGFIVDIQR